MIMIISRRTTQVVERAEACVQTKLGMKVEDVFP